MANNKKQLSVGVGRRERKRGDKSSLHYEFFFSFTALLCCESIHLFFARVHSGDMRLQTVGRVVCRHEIASEDDATFCVANQLVRASTLAQIESYF